MALNTDEVRTTMGGREYVSRAIPLMAEAFATDPVITYLLHHMTPAQFTAYLPKYFNGVLTAAAMNKGIFAEADDFKSCTILLPPGCHVDNFWTLIPAGFIGMVWDVGVKAAYRMLGELLPKVDAVKFKALRGQKNYYFIFFTATDSQARGRGLCSKLIKEFQAIAQKDGLPIWIEGTTDNSAKVYAKCGFELVERIKVGEGVVDADGKLKKGGEGVVTRGMIWWPIGKDGKKMYPVAQKSRGNWQLGALK
ncbi:hypothetical protein VTL71DRAFT_7986 [Oculimacula yallundae]|uniref:N-acetyltransferase domain-containing protein n=1 Tax=Oculimacula yallundae TaxID=86028 RepID=A0ABR4CW92_9HELO